MSSFSNNSLDDFPVYNDSFGDDSSDAFGSSSKPTTRLHMIPLVLLCGIVTTVLAFVLNVVILIFTEIEVLLFTMFHVVPIGAFLLGIVGGLGYSLSARFLHFFPSKRFLIALFFVQVGMFLGYRYTEYLLVSSALENPPGFIEFYLFHMEGFAWQGGDNQAPVPLGKAGYLFELAIVLLFSIGSVFITSVLMGRAYCKSCRVFMQSGLNFDLPASAPKRKVKKKDTEGQELLKKENDEAFARAAEYVKRVATHLLNQKTKDRDAVMRLLLDIKNEAGLPPKAGQQYWHILRVTAPMCPNCSHFTLSMIPCTTNPQDKTTPELPHLLLLSYDDSEFPEGEFLAFDGIDLTSLELDRPIVEEQSQ